MTLTLEHPVWELGDEVKCSAVGGIKDGNRTNMVLTDICFIISTKNINIFSVRDTYKIN